MPYKYDVFISYKRSKLNEEWMDNIFFPHFEAELDNALTTSPRIFIDRTGLTPGVDFTNELFSNLIFSKCLASIWSPPYFRKSEWCVKEFLTMRYKQERFQLNPNTKPKTLLWPILYRTFDSMPMAIKNINYLDYSKFNVVGDAFRKSDLFMQFQQQIQKDIKSLVEIINHAPDYNEYWDTPEGSQELVTSLQEYYEDNDDFDKPVQQAPAWTKK